MLRRWRERVNLTDIVMFIIGASILALALTGTVLNILHPKFTEQQWWSFVVDGLTLGSIYALIALGYTLVYGILRMINFAHSEVFMSGPFTAYFLADWMASTGFLEENLLVGLLAIFALAMTISTIVAVLLERIAYRPLRFAPRLVPLITAIGASFFLQYFFKGLYGPNIKVYPEITALRTVVEIGAIRIRYLQIFVIVAALLMMAGLQLFVMYTRTGKAMRAVAEDKETAALMGIDIDRIIVITFVLGGALAGAAGVLFGLTFKQVKFDMGFIPGIKAFTAAVLGGIGNVVGAMVGGMFLGVTESIGPSLFLDPLGVPSPGQLKDAIAFTLLVLVLIFRPSGILGERLAEKKA